ncbi:GDYXXLXY domain-containing protein [Paenibacillus doosanensis]|uniref:GDYXXLXY domain-containing protein n=1 Tax=Paenibacillus doosanensis TaxID=1229154 RepID=UPI002180445E|nr:GDYXXLXY domain-containing protein [Paenibacillus doosanensis]MCS7462651.1 GDYXXLXY domain-containing protein [Paenibacillus doosanensis]
MIGNRTIAKRSWLLSILVALQVLFLGGIAVSYYAVGWFGNEIKLQTEPVDPRDLLYGDYVTLGYQISRVDKSLWHSGNLPDEGEKVYVLLKRQQDGLFDAAGVYSAKPAVQPGEAVLIGTVSSVWGDSLGLTYGLERYYVPEGTGQELEKQAGNMIVTVKAASWGAARIMALEPGK